MAQGVSLDDPNLESRLSKSDSLEKMEFEASVTRGVQTVFKKGDDFVIWGPASVEIVDKEGDKISAEALGKALPQLLRRARLSLEHTDQIVGRILERFVTEDPVEIEINDQRYERSEFPTDVLDLGNGDPPALYVAGEVYEDTQQSKRARERIQDGELTSYSISGEALVTRKKVDDGTVYDDILDLDLSAVTLCEEGMNQGAAYAKVEGELSDKELAGEATDEDVSKQDVPVLEHPTTQTVDADGAGSTDPQTATVSKNMSDDNSDEEPQEKSGGATVEDVLKRLPEDGELATKDDLESVQKDAVDAVQDSLPEGNLATVEAMKSIVEDEVATQIEAALERSDDARKSVQQLYAEAETAEEFETAFKQEYGSGDADVDVPSESGEGSSPADSMSQETGGPDQAGDSYPEAAADDEGNTTGGSDAPDQGSESMDDRGVSTTSDKSDNGDTEMDKQEPEGNGEMGAPSDGPSMEPPHPDDYQTQEAWQADYEAWSADFEEYATEEAEDLEDGEGGDDGEEKSVDEDTRAHARALAQSTSKSLGEILQMLKEGDYEEDDEEDEKEMPDDEEEEDEGEKQMPDEEDDGMPVPEGEPEDEGDPQDDMMAVLEESLPADVFEVVREYVGGDQIAREDAEKIAAAAKSNDDESEDDLDKTVEDVLQGGAEVQGGTAIPTDPNDSQVDKQYSSPDEGGDGGAADASPALSNFYG